ncbi:hypothetical protein LTR53_002974 [Teratosphaeriaceae sp. CCFEE 6253]|nr:hypothetical protein LTR53_002974 [Teratosphaeriaceae sp. CCFEE 6253]
MKSAISLTAALAAFSLPLLAHAADAGCNPLVFLELSPARTFQSTPKRVSDAITCTAPLATGPNGSCPVQAYGYVSYPFVFNITLPENITSPVPDASVSGSAVNSSISGVVMNETFYLQPGQSGYVELAEEYDCITGLLDGCTVPGLNGTYVEACYPLYNTGMGTTPMFYNTTYLLSNATPVDAEAFGKNPYALPAGMAANGSAAGNGSSAVPQSNGGKVGMGYEWQVKGAMGLAAGVAAFLV